jgi:predicted porin
MLGGWDSPYKVSIGGITGMAVTGGWAGHNGPAIGNGDSTGANPNANCDNLTQTNGTLTGVAVAAGGVTAPVCPRGLEAGSTQFHRRIANTIQYWSPKFGGFDFRVAMTANEEKSRTATGLNNNPQLWAASGTYSAGPWYATVAYEQHRGYRDTPTATSTVNTKDKGWLIGGGYNFGAAALNLGYERLKYGNSTTGATSNQFTRPSWFIGASVPLGPSGSALRAGYSKMSKLKSCGANATCGSATGLSVFTLGYEYALSKRTAAYVQYGTIRNKALSAVLFNTPPLSGVSGAGAQTSIGNDQDPTILGVGMKHTF